MSHTSLFRFAGWSSILSILFSFGMFALISGGRGGAFMVVSIIASLFTLVVFYALFVFHRSQAATMSLAMCRHIRCISSVPRCPIRTYPSRPR